MIADQVPWVWFKLARQHFPFEEGETLRLRLELQRFQRVLRCDSQLPRKKTSVALNLSHVYGQVPLICELLVRAQIHVLRCPRRPLDHVNRFSSRPFTGLSQQHLRADTLTSGLQVGFVRICLHNFAADFCACPMFLWEVGQPPSPLTMDLMIRLPAP